ncbi:aminotransferase class V-fold PLP-dependent enzyme [Streptomyces sp. HNM0663]|uniref:Aminotransferase class V-fold PLP-dependent enzyme n=1 Tax=Streptomyces chengmaiensis TaxID=3040919 RepID=A0ABT6HHJ5_9ACTN|nr:aminotransferase class V-fold PLP-dependent enzyme [Streptomyces chengmaiensis]MDH2388148.1 aminotransferase class V-fold PLP-dependent enzyme [Streptomyces chengmaiensis]
MSTGPRTPRNAPRAPLWNSYLNTAGSGLQSPETRQAVAGFLALEAAVGSYFAERSYTDVLNDRVYQAVSELFHCSADDVAMSDSATRAWHSAVAAISLTERDTVWTTPYEWAGNLLLLRNAQKKAGFAIEEVPLTPAGDVDLDWCCRHLTDDVALFSVTHVPSCTGTVTPLAPLADLVRGRRTLLAVDACQSAGLIPLDLTATPVDLLTATGKKALLGPRGTGFAVMSERFRAVAEPVSVDVHTHAFGEDDGIRRLTGTARRFELGEKAVPSFVGLDTALRQARHNDWGRIADLSRELLERVRQIPGVRVHTAGTHHAGILCVTHERLSAEDLWSQLCWAGVACWLIDGAHTPHHLLRAGIPAAVRLAVGPRTTREEIDYGASALEGISRRATAKAPMPAAATTGSV